MWKNFIIENNCDVDLECTTVRCRLVQKVYLIDLCQQRVEKYIEKATSQKSLNTEERAYTPSISISVTVGVLRL